MRLLQLRHFIPSWRGRHHFPAYVRWRLETMGQRPTLRETWAYLGWCRDMNETGGFLSGRPASGKERCG